MNYYTYIHYREDDNIPFYIGKGQNNRHRMSQGRNKYWQNIVQKHGFISELLSIFETEQEAFEHEAFLIKIFKEMGYKLANLSDGGEGPSGYKQTEEHKDNIRKAQLGKKHTQETKDKIKKK